MKNYFKSKFAAIDALADKAILFLASLSLFAFMSFAWTIAEASKVSAQNTQNVHASQSCGGNDLIEQLATNNPEKLKQLESQAQQIINGNNVFWKIEKEGIPTSYLLGTMHMADERIAKLEGERLEAFKKADTLIIENTAALDPAKAQAAMAKLQHLTMLEGETLNDLLDEQTLKLLEPAVTASGIPFQIAVRLRPWLVATTISIPLCEAIAKQSGKPILDALLAQKAMKDGKQIIGLETMEEQLSAIATLPREFHISALKETLLLGDIRLDVMETMKLLYIKGEIGKVQPLLKIVSPESTNHKDNKRFEEQLIVKRNGVMAERAKEHLAKGNVFLAVGALHLPGETGLVKLLKENGYTLKAL
ncbi:MAG: TraB/GumN family protein [Nitratireductor sp.]